MGRNRIPPIKSNVPAAKIALNVVLKNSTINKPKLKSLILSALKSAGHHSFGITHVGTFLDASLAPKKDLVGGLIKNAKRKYQDRKKEFKVRRFRVKDAYQTSMDEATLALWKQQLELAKAEATTWDKTHEHYDPAEARRDAAIQNIRNFNAQQRQKKDQAAASAAAASAAAAAASAAAASAADVAQPLVVEGTGAKPGPIAAIEEYSSDADSDGSECATEPLVNPLESARSDSIESADGVNAGIKASPPQSPAGVERPASGRGR